jgi:hypothetical protein
MFSFNQLTSTLNTPIGIGIFAALVTMVYLILMSINSYLPPVLLLSVTIGYIVYYIQSKCGQCPVPQQALPAQVTVEQQQRQQQQQPLPVPFTGPNASPQEVPLDAAT